MTSDDDIAKAALALYDFDPDTEGDREAAETAGEERGSFADILSTTDGPSL